MMAGIAAIGAGIGDFIGGLFGGGAAAAGAAGAADVAAAAAPAALGFSVPELAGGVVAGDIVAPEIAAATAAGIGDVATALPVTLQTAESLAGGATQAFGDIGAPLQLAGGQLAGQAAGGIGDIASATPAGTDAFRAFQAFDPSAGVPQGSIDLSASALQQAPDITPQTLSQVSPGTSAFAGGPAGTPLDITPAAAQPPPSFAPTEGGELGSMSNYQALVDQSQVAPGVTPSPPSGETAAGAARGGSLWDSLKGWGGTLKDVGQFAVPAFLAAEALSARGQQKGTPQQQQISALGAQEAAFAQQGLANYESGTLLPGQQLQVNKYVQDSVNQARQAMANSGMDWRNNTTYLSMVQQIQQNAGIMQADLLTKNLSAALSAGGQGTTALTEIVNEQTAADKEFQTALGNAINATGIMFGGKAATQRTP